MHALVIAALLAVLSVPAFAADSRIVKTYEEPPPPAGSQYFFWAEGGTSSFDGNKVHAFDYGPTGVGESGRSPLYDDVDRGWLVRGELGARGMQRIGPFDTISVAAAYRQGSSDLRREGSLSLDYTSPLSGSSGTSTPDGIGRNHQDFSLLDVQLRLKHHLSFMPGVSINAEPFAAVMKHDSTSAFGIGLRTSDVDAHLYGFQLAAESSHQVGQYLNLRGRASIGAYYAMAHGDFYFASTSQDSVTRNFNGLRAAAEIGADFALSRYLSLGVTAGVEHWSALPYARMTTESVGEPVGLKAGGFTDYFVAGRITLATGAL